MIRVLGARRIGLQAAEGAERRQVGPVEAAEQILPRVEDGGGVRFDRDAITGAQEREVERGENGRYRGRRRLVPADFALVGVGPDIVGVVDDLGREPEQAALDRFQGRQGLWSETALVGWRGHHRTGGTLDRCAHLRGLLGSRGGDSYASMVIQGLALRSGERRRREQRYREGLVNIACAVSVAVVLMVLRARIGGTPVARGYVTMRQSSGEDGDEHHPHRGL